MQAKVAIIGAGISGLACALHLAQRGNDVTIWEYRKREELTPASARAVSLDISARGIYALKHIGLFDQQVKKYGVQMTHKIFHDRNGQLTKIPYGPTDKHYILALSRNYLFEILLDAASKLSNIQINFLCKLEQINFTKAELIIRNLANNKIFHEKPNIIIGADGINSLARAAFEKYTGLCFSSTPMPQAYKEISIPKEMGLSLELNATLLWSRNELMLVAQPNPDHSFMCALLMPREGADLSFESIRTKDELENLFQANFNDVRALMPNLHTEYQQRKVGFLRILQGQSWVCEGKFVLIGDAAHGMVPFFGQGVNCCFEDCTVLDQCLNESNDHWPTALLLFNQRRVINGNAISSMSFSNYPELLQRNLFQQVLLKKQIETKITKVFRSEYISYHNLVCFHRVPYVYALACKKLQEPMLDRLASRIEHVDDLDWTLVEQEVQSYQKQLNCDYLKN